MNELLYSSQGYSEFPFASHSGSSWEGQQNSQYHSGENSTADNYESDAMAQMSHGGAVSGIDTRSYTLCASSSWGTEDTSVAMLEHVDSWIIHNSREVFGSPPTSARTVTPDHPVKAISVELRPTLSQMSHAHSDITDRSFSVPDTGLYPNSPNYADNQIYIESKYIDDMDSSVSYGSFRNGDVKATSRRSSQLLPVATGSSFPTYTTSPDEVMFTSPMDVMSHAMFDSSISQDGVSSALDPMNINDSLWAPWDIDQPGSGVSTPYSTDAWSATANAKKTANYSPNQTQSPRTNRKSIVQNGRVAGDHSTNYQLRGSDASGFYDGPHPGDRGHNHGSVDSDNIPREHPLYQKATTGPDGLYHCPWEGKDPSCNHKPEKLKCNYDKFVDSHLKPYRCKVHACENARFSSTACLLRHEREAHAMHGHGEKPFLCTFEGCERGVPGNGFPRHWNLCDHMKRVHNRSPSPPQGAAKAPRNKKRKNSSTEASSSKKSPTTGSATTDRPRAPVRSLSSSEQFQHGQQQLLSTFKEMPDLTDTELTPQKIEKANQVLSEIQEKASALQQQLLPRMERRLSQQSV